MGAQRRDDRRDVAIGTGVVVAEEPNGQGNTQIVVEEACKEGVCLTIAKGYLGYPVNIVLGKPEKAVQAHVYACP